MKYLLFLAAVIGSSIASFATVTGSTINIAAGTKVVASGNVYVSSNASFFINDGTYTDTTGTLNVFAGLTFSGTGTTSLKNIVVNNGGTTTFNALVSVYNTATITAGSVNAGSGNLYIRSDVNASASLVNNGVLTGTVQGLVTKATMTVGACPSYTSTLMLNISGSSMQYQWQSSADSATWTNITGATAATYVATVTSTMYYRCNLSTTNSSYTQTTPGVKLTFTGVTPTIALGSSPSVSPGTTSANLPYTATTGTPTTYSIVYSSAAIGAGFSNVSSASLPASPIVLTVPSAAPAAVYSGTLTVSNGCTSSGAAFTVTIGSSFDATITGTNVTCNGGSDGAATVTATGGTTPYTYSWAPSGGTGSTATGLTAGTYTVTITDATAAVISRTVTITQPTAITITGTQVNVTCNGGNSGSATVSVSGGAGGYSYSWSPVGGTLATATGLFAGTYTCSVTDGSGCLATHTFTITQPTAMSVTPTQVNVTCNGGSDASATVSVTGGTGSHYYYWSPGGSTSATVTGLSAGTYTCAVTDDNGCVTFQYVTITQPSVISITGTQVNVTCNGGSNGSATVTVTGGAGSYSYSWSPGGSTLSTATGLSAGTYTCTVIDGTGCSKIQYFTITQPSAISISGTQVNVTCNGGSDGAATVTVTGGTGSYSYSWSLGGSTLATATGLSAGSYTCTVVDGSGCMASQPFTITQPAPLSAISGSSSVCAGYATTLSDDASGGSWSSSNTSVATVDGETGVVTGIIAGTTTITYAIGGDCSAFVTKVVTVNTTPAAITGTALVCVGGTTTLSSTTSGGTWSSVTPPVATVNTLGVVTGVSVSGTTISYTLSNGCAATRIVTVTPAPGTITGTRSVCVGDNTNLSASGSGGSWTSGNTGVASVTSTGIVSGVVTGTAVISYTIGTCTSTAVVTVNALPNAGTITGPSNVTVGSTITLSSSATGGTWVAGNSNATVSSGGVVTGTAAGTVVISYVVTNGCGTAVATKTITVNAAVSGITGTLTVCAGSTTLLSDATPGGSWSSGSTSIATIDASSGVVSGIAAGTATISYITADGYATVVVTVYATPSAITGTMTLCEGSMTTLNNSAVGYGTWTSSDISVASVGSSSGVVTALESGTATITYTLSSGCLATAMVTVNPLPADITGAAGLCAGNTISLGSATPGGSWTSGDPSTASVTSTGLVNGLSGGIAQITYTLTTGCKTSTTVTVYALPAAITGTGYVCEGAMTNLSNTTLGGSWSSSDLSVATIGTSGTVLGVSAGTSTISYVTGAGCARSTIVTVNQAPTISGSVLVCPGTTATLTPSLPGGTWSGGSASIATIGTSGVVTGIGAGNTNFTYTLASGCRAYATGTVNANPATITGVMKACLATSTTLSNSTPGGTWSSSDITIATADISSGVVSGVTAGTVTITYTAGIGCYRTTPVTINASPAAIMGNGAPTCIGTSFTLTDASPGLSWSSSNTSVATITSTGVVTGMGTGTSTITYTAASTNCTATTEVTINSAPGAITGPGTACTGAATTLTNTVPGGTWSSSNTSIATINATTGVLTGITSGIITVGYTTGAGCSATKQMTINNGSNIKGYPTVCIGLTTTLSGGSVGTWISSDPSVATIAISGGYVSGISAGTAIMTYTSSTPGTSACPATYMITVVPIPPAITGITTACTGSTTTLGNSSAGGSWTSANTAVATVGSATGIVTAVGSGGSTTISYSIGNNCRATTTFTPKPVPAVFGGSIAVCMPTVSTITDVTGGGTWTSSDVSIATIGSAVSVGIGVMTGVSAGTATVTYTISATGCYRSTVVTVTAGPDPGTLTSSTGAFTLHTVSAPTSLTLSSSGAPGGTWSSSNSGVATVNASGLVSAVASGNTTITYTVTGACTNRVTRLISVASGKEAGIAGYPGDFSLYPNPTPGTFNLTTSDAGTMTVYTIDGKMLYSFDVKSGSSAHSLKEGMSAGVYMCRFTGVNGTSAVVRLVYEP